MDVTNKSIIKKYIIIFSIILVFDLLTIVANIYIAPILENFGMPDVLIYLKALISLTSWGFFLTVYKKDLSVPTYIIKTIIFLAFTSVLAYFFSVFFYKFVLLTDVSSDILNKILRGNSNIILDVSRKNYNVLEYMITIYGGANSEIVLLFEVMALQFAITKTKDIIPHEEKEYLYDFFMYDKILKPLPLLLLGMSFLSINLFKFRFDLLGAFEMAVSLLAFALIVPGVFLVFKLNKTKNLPTTKSLFVGTHKYLRFMSILCIVLFILLITLNITFIVLERGTYRITTSVFSLLLSILILVRTNYILSLENK